MKARFCCTLFAAVFILFFGCNKPNDTGTGTGTGGGTNPDPNPPAVTCKSCEYYPVCDSSYFTYLDSVYPAAPILYTDTFRVQPDTTINGLLYKKIKRISTRYPSTEYMNCSNGIYRVGGKYGFGAKPLILLKANEPVGTSWTETSSTGVNVNFSIIEKGSTLSINGHNYIDVIKVKFMIQGSGSTYSAYYYFAKGVGIVKFEFGEWNFDPNWYHRNNLQSYFIP